MTPKKTGRPTKLTPEVSATIVEAIKAGNTREVASHTAGIWTTTFYSWMERGEAGEDPFAQFYDDVKKADVAAAVEALKSIRCAFDDSWQAAAWYLERRYPETWGKRERHEIEHSGQVTRNVKVDLSKLTDEQLSSLEAIAESLED